MGTLGARAHERPHGPAVPRWVNSLDPNKRAVNEAPWTAEEDAALVEAVELLGTEEVERGAAPGTPAAASDRPTMQGPLGEAP